MERFVQLIVAGGLATVAGLWLAALEPGGPPARYLGAAVAAAGAGVLLWGIRSELAA